MCPSSEWLIWWRANAGSSTNTFFTALTAYPHQPLIQSMFKNQGRLPTFGLNLRGNKLCPFVRLECCIYSKFIFCILFQDLLMKNSGLNLFCSCHNKKSTILLLSTFYLLTSGQQHQTGVVFKHMRLTQEDRKIVNRTTPHSTSTFCVHPTSIKLLPSLPSPY